MDNQNEQKEYEQRLQTRLKILKEMIDNDKVKFVKDMQIIESLKKMRYAPDGSFDLLTVDSAVRSMALGVEYFHDREETKKIATLEEIQNNYFNFLSTNFSMFYDQMIDKGSTPEHIARFVSNSAVIVDDLIKVLPDFLETLFSFWESAEPVVRIHIEDLSEIMKGVFGGDLFPSYTENIASKCGLYVDTLVLPDPFVRSRIIFREADDKTKIYYLIKHAMNILQYKELACVNISPPIIIIYPDQTEFNDDEKKYIYNLGQEDSIYHASKIFGRIFATHEEMIDYCKNLDTVEKAVAAVKDPSRVLFDTEWDGSLSDQLIKRINDPLLSSMLPIKHPGLILASQAVSRMGTSNELLVKTSQLRGIPLIDAPTSWQYFVWKLEYDSYRNSEILKQPNIHIVHALQNLSNKKFQWIGNIPPKDLIDIRKTGALSEIRDILGSGIDSIAKADPYNFLESSNKVLSNIDKSFSEHQQKIKEITSKKLKFAGFDIGSWLVVGSLAVTAAATGSPLWGVAALAADQVLPSPKLNEIPQKIKDLVEDNKKLKRSAVGVLFNLSKK